MDPKFEGRPHLGSEDQGRHHLREQPQLWRPPPGRSAATNSLVGDARLGKEVMQNYTETKSVAINLG